MAPRPSPQRRTRPLQRRPRGARRRQIAVASALGLFLLLSIGPVQSYFSARSATAKLRLDVQRERERRDALRLSAPNANDRASTVALLRGLGYSFTNERVFHLSR